MKIFYLIVFFALIFSGSADLSAQVSEKSSRTTNSKKKQKIRFDGFYCEANDDGRSCLRFYEDGVVLDVALAEEVTDEDLITSVPEWFNSESDRRGSTFGAGSYRIRKSKITFSTLHNFAKVRIDYTGTIEDSGKTLVLDMFSNYNGNRQQGARFEFVQLLRSSKMK